MRVFKYNIFSLSNIISIAITISMYAGMFLLPIYLQNIRGYSAFDSGLLFFLAHLLCWLCRQFQVHCLIKWDLVR